MRLRTLADLDLRAAWTRTMSAVRREDLADRLPFEVTNRLVNAGHRDVLQMVAEFSPGAPIVYFAPKESRTLRPFVALSPRDLLLYQALVDRSVVEIRSALPPDDVVYAYRPTDRDAAASIENRSWSDFQHRARAGLESGSSHILETDIAGFFLHIRPQTIVQRLLSVGVDESVSLDIGDLLGHFLVDGVHGLPQGLAPSSALSNLALMPLDRSFADDDNYFRWSDDIRYLAPSFSAGTAIQEKIERILYTEGFSIGAGKTSVTKAATALGRMTDLQASLDAIRDENLREAISNVGPYDEIDEAEAVADADYQAAGSFYEETIAPLRKGEWSKDRLFRTKLRFILRTLSRHANPVALKDAVDIAFRYPDQIVAISRYLQQMAGDQPSAVRSAVELIARKDQIYVAEYVRLGLAIAAGPLAGSGPSPELSETFASFALDPTANTILRRRAATTAAALSAGGSGVPSQLWDAFQLVLEPELSRLYVVAGTAGHPDRDELYAVWRGESRLITASIDYFSKNSLDLAKV